MNKHTPGPWRVYDMPLPSRKMVVIQPDICQIHQKNRRVKYYAISQLDEETRANATLIASAPDLLEALRKFIHFMDSNGLPVGENDIRMLIPSELARHTRVVIAEAEGRK